MFTPEAPTHPIFILPMQIYPRRPSDFFFFSR